MNSNELPQHIKEKSKHLKMLNNEQIQHMMTQASHSVEEEFFNLTELESSFNEATVKKTLSGIGKLSFKSDHSELQ